VGEVKMTSSSGIVFSFAKGLSVRGLMVESGGGYDRVFLVTFDDLSQGGLDENVH